MLNMMTFGCICTCEKDYAAIHWIARGTGVKDTVMHVATWSWSYGLMLALMGTPYHTK